MQYAAQEVPRKSSNKLREYAKKGKELKYLKHAKELEHSDFRFPSELFSTFGIMELGNNYQDLKSSQIPHVAIWCFGVELTNEEVTRFSDLRDLRNKVAHGKVTQIEFNKANSANRFLRNLSIKIDKHVIKHFFVIEKNT